VKEIYAPHIGRNVKLGRKRPKTRLRLHLRDYLRLKDLPPAPTSVDYSIKAASSIGNIYLNDQYGDCVIAGGYHIVGVETGNASDGSPFIATDAQIVADYSAIGGFDPSNPQATDQGCDEQTALTYWTTHGFADGTKLLGSTAVDASNPSEVMQALWLFENLLFGIELPDAWIQSMPSASGFVWDVAGDPDPNNGHCVIGVGYNDQGVQIATWGMIGTITWAAVEKYCTQATGGELYVVLTPDQLDAGQDKAPNGIAWSALQDDFTAMAGLQPAPLPPTPAPSPSGVTLAQAQAALAALPGWPS
jgi:hypothetical protein